ncbi:MAG: class I SAM-dependent methyltransferase [Nostoc sp. NMS1]|uniref:class I SAM-dependent methyltransferase n=1 Tax=unclassified Nostoc TaxID=2593658 RepID=UPI0025CD1DA5|nr:MULTISPECIES: class I SAM-dependent methyltransferase [unclassified Nostoc]MBN3908039.1 class I SAM-dependent methyltransferase [Nostoc sp. NMS1]MBN3990558.1 class I SAM-dependent methyltransferase [Nostoc sp. NMS2]
MSNVNHTNSTKNLYNRTASDWIRGEPSSLSDFTARPFVLELCEPVGGLRVLDIGCGEGYCSRELRRRGAAQVHGIDLSQGMIEAAKLQEAEDVLGISYEVGCATNLKQFDDGEIDLVVAVFLFNYLTISQTQECMAEVVRILRPGGRFVFSVPHPSFPYMREASYPFYFQVEGAGYFSKRDQQFPGRIWKRDGSWLNVQLIHKTLEDYFNALRIAGFNTMPILQELRVTPEHIAVDQSFFSPLLDQPLHIALQISR